MGFYGNKNYKYDKTNTYNYDYSGIKPSGYYELTDEDENEFETTENIDSPDMMQGTKGMPSYDDYVVDYPQFRDDYVESKGDFPEQDLNQSQNLNPNQRFNQKFNQKFNEKFNHNFKQDEELNQEPEDDLNEEISQEQPQSFNQNPTPNPSPKPKLTQNIIPSEESCDIHGFCDSCYKYKDLAGEKWQESNELADAARLAGCEARKSEEKAEYYKKLADDEAEKSKKYWEDYRNLSTQSLELMREARKCIAKFEECLRDCDLEDIKNNKKCFGENFCTKPECNQKPDCGCHHHR